MRFARIISLFSLCVACGEIAHTPVPDASMDSVVDASVDAPSPAIDTSTIDASTPIPYPAPHPPLPHVNNLGGPLLTSPVFVPIVFAGDPALSEITQLYNQLGNSTYWNTTTSEYGISAATSLPMIVLSDTPAQNLSDAEIQSDLDTYVNAPNSTWPQPNSQIVYAIYYPSTTTIGWNGSVSCQQFFGYHGEWQSTKDGSYIPYAVIPRCSFRGLSEMDTVTAATSHELIEAVTDPHISTQAAYALPDSDHFAWRVFPTSEIGDMCAFDGEAFFTPMELGVTVQRTWSNLAAAAGKNPCVPAPPGDVYFNSIPVLTDEVEMQFGASGILTKGVSIAVGETKTIDVDLFSDAPTSGPWSVTASDYSSLSGSTANLQLVLDSSTGQNGDVLHLTITALQAGDYGGSVFVLFSALGPSMHSWTGFVRN